MLDAGMETDDVSHMIEYLWHKGPDFDKDGAAVPLIFRIATVEDKKRLTADHKTRCAFHPGMKLTFWTSAWVSGFSTVDGYKSMMT